MCQPVDISPLLEPVAALPGVTPAVAEKLARVAAGDRILDLLFHLPEAYIDRRTTPTLAEATPGAIATVELQVLRIDTPARGTRQPFRVHVQDRTSEAELSFWRTPPPAFVQPGANVTASGKIESFAGRIQIRTPVLIPGHRRGELAVLEPVYPLTAGLFTGQVRAAMRHALARLPDLPEWHDPPLLRREAWPGFRDALRALHTPLEIPTDAPRQRLAYDELLAHQIAMAWTRRRNRTRPGHPTIGDGHLRAQALARFGHTPTPSQTQALAEIDKDLAAPRRMLRLLQGDVGSGKTLVALLAMLRAAEAGRQAALMAPTEVLAKQHLRTIAALAPIPVELLTGAVKGRERSRILTGLASGRLQLVVGTHALFQPAVEYRDLALAVIDEQHRFGVDQRLTLGGKGPRTDVLVMTATPIPRTLLLTQWGEMDISRLTEKPAGRKPIRTTIHPLATLDDVIAGIGRALARNDRVYWVCPMISENDLANLAAAEARYAALAEHFGDTVALAHGRQDPLLRDRALAAFARGEKRLLVATTVIEVGVDVPEANIMVIEHAERFGLAQLHQLRGRVGRGAAQSYCLLLHDDGLTETMRRRLVLLRDTEDGFVIADEDFRLRGGGDLLGKRQSGLPGYRLADPEAHERLIHIAARDAALILDREPALEGPRGPALQPLMRLFGRAEAIRTLDAG